MRAVLAAFVLAALALAPLPASSASAPADGMLPVFTKLNPVQVEYWDQNGLFHALHAEIVMVSAIGQPLPSKSVFERIQKALAAWPYERLLAAGVANTVKSVALEVIRKEANGENVSEVLVGNMLMR